MPTVDATALTLSSRGLVLGLLLLLAVYPVAGRTVRARVGILLLFSLAFYVRASGLFVVLLVASTLFDHWLARTIAASEVQRDRRRRLAAGIVANVGILVLFRYTPAWSAVLERVGSEGFRSAWSVIPVGVSFFTFQKIAYLVDVYRRRTEPAANWREFLLFVSFFPRVLAGPIVRASQFLPQIGGLALPGSAAVRQALPLLVSGLLKKAVVADYIGVNFVDRVFATPTLYSGTEALLATYGYAIQIYCDFSGYTDLALGVAALLGVQLPRNFDAPYRAGSVTEFWRRWHITLSEWLRDYVFLPVAYALSRRIAADRVLGVRSEVWVFGGAALVTWSLCGLWHGATAGFLAWGLLHGAVVTVEKVTRWPQRMNRTPRRRLVAQVVTFHVVCVAWVLFRGEDLATSATLLGQILSAFHLSLIPEVVAGYPLVCALIGLGAGLQLLPDRAKDVARNWLMEKTLPAQCAILAVTMWVVLQMRAADIQAFIYFRF